MLPRPFPFPFLGNRAQPPPLVSGTDPAPPSPGGVFYPRSWPCDPHRLSPSLLASGTGSASPGLQSSFSIPIPGPATRTDSTLPRWHREQAFLPGRRSRSLSGAAACLPLPPSGWAPRALSPATQKSPGASPQGICFVSFRSAPSGTAALPAGAWAAPPPGSRNRLPPRRSTR